MTEKPEYDRNASYARSQIRVRFNRRVNPRIQFSIANETLLSLLNLKTKSQSNDFNIFEQRIIT